MSPHPMLFVNTGEGSPTPVPFASPVLGEFLLKSTTTNAFDSVRREQETCMPHGRVVDGKAAFHVLRRVHGDEIAEIAVALDASQASIERALRAVAVSTGATLAKLKREAMRLIAEAGGVSVKTSRVVKEYRPDTKSDTPEPVVQGKEGSHAAM